MLSLLKFCFTVKVSKETFLFEKLSVKDLDGNIFIYPEEFQQTDGKRRYAFT